MVHDLLRPRVSKFCIFSSPNCRFFSIYDKTYFAVGRLGKEKQENWDYDNQLIFLCSPKNWVPLLLPFKDIPNLFRPPYWLTPPPQTHNHHKIPQHEPYNLVNLHPGFNLYPNLYLIPTLELGTICTQTMGNQPFVCVCVRSRTG